MSVTLNVNGVDREIDATPDTPILWAIRDHLEMTGTKFGCGMAQCGACTVHLNGQPIRSCVTPIQAAVGQKITTIEGIQSRAAQVVQQAWDELQVRNVDTASQGKSCLPLRCSNAIRIQAMRILMLRCRATFVAVQPMFVFAKRLKMQPLSCNSLKKGVINHA